MEAMDPSVEIDNNRESRESSPDAEACDEASKQFAAITETDEACAHFFLQDHGWKLQPALNAFYGASEANEERNDDSSTVQRSAHAEESGPSAARKRVSQSSSSQTTNSGENSEILLKELKVLSWNIDGLDNKNFNIRVRAVCTVIIKEKPHIIFLQEVVAEAYSIIDHYLNDEYLLISGQYQRSLVSYFTLMLLRRKEISCRNQTVKPFPSTMMGRTLLIVEATVEEKELLLLTSHLESTKEGERERKKQLQTAFQACSDAHKDTMVIFGGDLNIRDTEMDAIGGIPDRLVDVWQFCGSAKFTEFTWDTLKNDNLQWEKKFKPRCRFDRLYVSKEGSFRPKDFMLVGMQRIQNCHCFPSDHFGIFSTLEVRPTE